jgi:hypothetical protein
VVQDGVVAGTGFSGTTSCATASNDRESKLDFSGTIQAGDPNDTGMDSPMAVASGNYEEAQTIFFSGDWEGEVIVDGSTTIEGTFENTVISTTFQMITVTGRFTVLKP